MRLGPNHWVVVALRDAFDESGFTKEQWALEANVHLNTVYRVLSGRGRPSFWAVERLAEALGYELEMMKGTE